MDVGAYYAFGFEISVKLQHMTEYAIQSSGCDDPYLVLYIAHGDHLDRTDADKISETDRSTIIFC